MRVVDQVRPWLMPSRRFATGSSAHRLQRAAFLQRLARHLLDFRQPGLRQASQLKKELADTSAVRDRGSRRGFLPSCRDYFRSPAIGRVSPTP